jgi:GT2 family glycosyltransferase
MRQKVNNEFDYEIIVIDNNSKDHTKNVVGSYVSQGFLTYLFEPKQGKSYALNRGINNAQGVIISCVDDDCTFDEDYLLNVYQAFKECDLQIGIVGGKVYPKWIGGDCPLWLDQVFSQSARLEDGRLNWTKISFEGVLGILDFGSEPFVLDYTQKDHPDLQFFGANMAFRKEVLEQYGGFNIDKITGEDSEICERLFNAGIKGFYAPTIGVYHKIPIKKGTPSFFYKWWFGRGINMDLEQEYVCHFGIPLGLIKKMMKLFIRSVQENDPLKKIRLRWQAFFKLGQMVK